MKDINVLGVDLGGVVISGFKNERNSSLSKSKYAELIPIEGAFETLKYLNKRFAGFAYIVSKCGPEMELKIRDWLKYYDFHKITGILETSLRFCRERKDKAAICEELKITHFIDDRLEVLSYLTTVPNKYLFRSSIKETQQFSDHLKKVIVVESWQELLSKIRSRL